MSRARLFKNNRSQAVRIPKAMELDERIEEVEMFKVGQTIVMVPTEQSWSSWFDGAGVSEDFMVSRDQPAEQDRESLE